MIKCPIYNETRDRLLPQSIIKNCYSSDETKLKHILGNSNSSNVILIAQYISESMSLRENKIKTDSLKIAIRKQELPLESDNNLGAEIISAEKLKIKISGIMTNYMKLWNN